MRRSIGTPLSDASMFFAAALARGRERDDVVRAGLDSPCSIPRM
jgi:hypothetical protein